MVMIPNTNRPLGSPTGSQVFPTLQGRGMPTPPIDPTINFPKPVPAPTVSPLDPNPALTQFFAGMVPATAANSQWPAGAPMGNPKAGVVGDTMPGNLFINPADPGKFFIKSNNDTGFWSFDPTNAVSAAPIKSAPTQAPASLPPVNLGSGGAPMLPPLAPPQQTGIGTSGNAVPPAMMGGAPAAPAAPAFDPIQFLQQLQSQAAPMANPIAGPNGPSPDAMPPPGVPAFSPPTGALPQVPVPTVQPPAPPSPTTTMGESVGAASPSVAPAAGGPSGGMSPALTPPTDNSSPIPFNPNLPTPAQSTLSPNASIEDFLGNLGGLQFGAQGILGVPGGPQRAPGVSEADFARQLISQGLLRGARPIAL